MKITPSTSIKFIALLAVCSLFTPLFTQSASAVTKADWDASRIIDDAIFFNPDRMSVQEIQNFLNAKVPTCDTNGEKMYNDTQTRAQWAQANNRPLPPYTCLKSYTQNIPGIAADSYCSGSIGAGTKSAATIIKEVALACNINPQVILVTLQKEQSLITDDWPWPVQYTKATGMGCPDTSLSPDVDANQNGCYDEYEGFFKQIYYGARQFQRYVKEPDLFNYAIGRNSYIAYQANNSSCGGTYITPRSEATAALYNYTPYQPNTAALDNMYGTGDACSAYGNRNFWRMWNDWFGTTKVPQLLKGKDNGTVYAYINGHKTVVPSMAILQDYGYDPSSITVINQSTMDAIPISPSPLSSSLGYIVKSPSDEDSDGSTVYLVSVGKRYPISSMDQFNSFGFSVSNISYLPLNYLLSVPSGGSLTQFILTPTSNVFKVSAGQKNIIFDYQKYISLNPSNNHTFVSTYTASKVSSGDPISDRDILVRKSNGSVYLFDNNTYYVVPSMNEFNCWGMSEAADIPMYTVANNSYLPSITTGNSLSCVVRDSQNILYFLNQNNKYNVPEAYGEFAHQVLNSNLTKIIERLPTNSAPVKRAVKSNNSSTVFWLDGGTKKAIPSIANFNLLGLTTSQVDVLSGTLSSIAQSGIKLGNGQVVKLTDSGTVYVIHNDNRIAFASGDDFVAYMYGWSQIETYPSSVLNSDYPSSGTNISKYLYDQGSNKVYLMDSRGCYVFSTQFENYGQNFNTIKDNQPYLSNLFPKLNLSMCKPASVYVKADNQGTVYWLENGVKRPFTSWLSLQNHSSQDSPYIITLSNSTTQKFPSGQPL